MPQDALRGAAGKRRTRRGAERGGERPAGSGPAPTRGDSPAAAARSRTAVPSRVSLPAGGAARRPRPPALTSGAGSAPASSPRSPSSRVTFPAAASAPAGTRDEEGAGARGLLRQRLLAAASPLSAPRAAAASPLGRPSLPALLRTLGHHRPARAEAGPAPPRHRPTSPPPPARGRARPGVAGPGGGAALRGGRAATPARLSEWERGEIPLLRSAPAGGGDTVTGLGSGRGRGKGRVRK